jgi:hypothetical protein
MALIKCGECGKEISDKAEACLECGCPIKQPQESVSSSSVKVQDHDSSTVKTSSSGGIAPEIPTGLYWATAILGFPLGTGMALGFSIGANYRIKKGDYVKAQKYINSTKVACWVILAICALIILIFFVMLSSILGR